MQAFESVSVRQASRRKTFLIQSPNLHCILINTVKEMDIGHFLIGVAGQPYSHQKRKHNECRQPELL
ncbi:hypothetical protein TNCV_1909731 [Trichonephila clavipes]|nr:hypothetical protein TNCV_1909731 [Trichonephila clavipes]